MAFDAVVTIGGQPFVDGLWRLLSPLLDKLDVPLPLILPGFTNSAVRVTNMVPIYPGLSPNPGLQIGLSLEVSVEALLQVVVESGSVTISLGDKTLKIDELKGDLVNLIFAGTTPLSGAPGAGKIEMLTTMPGSVPAGTGSVALGDAVVPGIPMTSVVPVALDITPVFPIITTATVPFSLSGPTGFTRQSLMFLATQPDVNEPGPISSTVANDLAGQLNSAIDTIEGRLGIPTGLAQSTVSAIDVQDLLSELPGAIANTLNNALKLLIAETGRILYPLPSTGASCDVHSLPSVGEARLVSIPDNGYELQVGLSRDGSTGDITALPSGASSGPEARINLGNSYLLSLLCCLIPRLPRFSLPLDAVSSKEDVEGNSHLMCCNFHNATLELSPIPVHGENDMNGVSVCIDGNREGPKQVSIVGRLEQNVPLPVPLFSLLFPTLATVLVRFKLPVEFDLDDASSLSDLRPINNPFIQTKVTPHWNLYGFILLLMLLLLAIAIGIALLVGVLVFPIVAPIITFMPALAAATIIGLVYVAAAAANSILRNGVRKLLSGASLLKSPVSLPPGILDAFGKLAPTRVEIDDLEADVAIHTPSSDWGLIPRIGFPGW